MTKTVICLNFPLNGSELVVLPLTAVGPVLCHVGRPWDQEEQDNYAFIEGEQWTPEQIARFGMGSKTIKPSDVMLLAE